MELDTSRLRSFTSNSKHAFSRGPDLPTTDNIECAEASNMLSAKRIALRIGGFILVLIALVALLSAIFAPTVSGNTNDDTVKGIYEQPANTVQITVFGPSTSHAGISSMELYKTHGYSAYNCSTSLQSFEMTYWLMREMIRLQGGEMKIALVDPSIIILGASDKKRQAQSEKALISMQYSPIRLAASLDLWKLYSNAGFVESLVPIVRYHTRWDELTSSDFEFASVGERSSFTHGQFIRYLANVESASSASIASKTNATVTANIDSSEDELRSMWNENDLVYLDKFVDLCNENGIQIIFFQTPRTDWNDKHHDSIQLLANEYGIPFLDLSSQEVIDELEISYPMDYVDKKHPNLHGAIKITRYIGSFISANYELEDKRQAAGYEFLQADANRYDDAVDDSGLLLIDNLEDYLAALDRDRYTVFISARGNAAAALSDKARSLAAGLGLENLSTLSPNCSYVGIIDAGNIAFDSASNKPGEQVTASGVYDDGTLIMRKTKMQPGATLKKAFSITSSGSKGAITLNDKQRSPNGEGINFVVCNKLTNEVIDTSCFDTTSGSERTSDRIG